MINNNKEKYYKKIIKKEKQLKNRIRIIFLINFIFLAFIVGNVVKFYIVDSSKIINNTLNPRVFINESNIKKGTIYNKNNLKLATSENGERVYLQGKENKAYFHTVGYITNEGFGLESSHSLVLQKTTNELKQILEKKENEKIEGNNVHLTLDGNLQQLAYDELIKTNKKGAVVIMETSTGKILALTSTPSIENKDIEYDMDKEDKYLNRATSGLYTPGSVFKVVSALTIMEHITDYEQYNHDCVGSITVDGNTVKCFNEIAHGKINLKEAIEQSCNTYFVAKGLEIGMGKLLDKSIELEFFKQMEFPIRVSRSSINLGEDIDNNWNVIQTYIGQGKTLVTPLHTAMIYAGIANGGIIMNPYIIDYISDYEGNIVDENRNRLLNKNIKLEEAEQLNEMLKGVVKIGTAKSLNKQSLKLAGKTGSAEVIDGKTNGWFAGYSPYDNPEISVVVLLEDVTKSSETFPLVEKLVEQYYKNKK